MDLKGAYRKSLNIFFHCNLLFSVLLLKCMVKICIIIAFKAKDLNFFQYIYIYIQKKNICSDVWGETGDFHIEKLSNGLLD